MTAAWAEFERWEKELKDSVTQSVTRSVTQKVRQETPPHLQGSVF